MHLDALLGGEPTAGAQRDSPGTEADGEVPLCGACALDVELVEARWRWNMWQVEQGEHVGSFCHMFQAFGKLVENADSSDSSETKLDSTRHPMEGPAC